MSTRPYPSYKDSGVEWLGRIPAHWQVKRLKYVVRQNPESLPETTDPDYELQYLDIGNVEEVDGVGSPQEMRFSNAPSRARRRVRSGDTIVSTVRTYLKAIAYFDDPPENLIVSTGFAVLRPNREVHPKFLHALVRSRQFVEKIVTRSVGVGYPAINPGELSCLPVWLPSPTEQQAIAAFLDRETGKLDALVKKKERLIELLQEKRTALISHAVTQGLNPNAPMKDSGITWLGHIPAHWEVKRLGVIACKITNGFVGPTRDILVDEGVRYLQSLHIKNGQIRFDTPYYVRPEWSEAHAKSVLLEGDVLIVQTGDLGQCCTVPKVFEGVNCHALIIVRLRQGVGSGFFLSAFLRSHYGRASLRCCEEGATLPHLECGKIREISIALPPPQEQQAIVEHIDRETTKLDALTTKVQTAIERLQEYRTALISAAVTGQIDVRASLS